MRNEKIKIFLGIVIFFLANITTLFSYTTVGVDETAYLAQAELIAGINWNDVMAGITYHSFGCAVIPGMIIRIFGSTVLAYRLILIHNSIIVTICYFLIYKIISSITPGMNNNLIAIISFVVVIYPSNLGYSNFLIAELYVTLGYLLISYILLRYFNSQEKKWLIMLGICSVYEMAVHQRTIGILMAVVIVLLFYLLKQKKAKDLLIFSFVFCVALLAFYLYKNYSQGVIWHNSELARENDFSSVVNSNMFERLVKKEFWSGMFYLSVGRVWYLGIASLGISLIGFSKTVKTIFDKDENETIKFLSLFWVVSFVLCWGVALYNSYIPAQIYHVILGRYMDALIAPFLIIGIISFISNGSSNRVWCYIIAVLLVLGMLTSRYADYVSQTKNYYHRLDNLGIYIVNSDVYSTNLFLRITLVMILFIVFATVVTATLKSKKMFIIFLAVFFIINSFAYDYDVISEQKKNKTAIVDFSTELEAISEEIGYFPEGAHYECRLKYLNPNLRFVQLNKNECVDGQTDYIMVVNDMFIEEKTMDIDCYSIYAASDYFTIYKYMK